eukprot:TRINITY_DN1633_c0_g2_i2.p1 TRINITY_DN1633_c0_g2~~TRINITY_DN1633_c0_g2_i2.p1  ORF type:complete len:685 (+),score=188.78 TRINITY_DN1633_c0_g2_i2:96-2150(+)
MLGLKMNRDNLLEAATTVEERIIKSNGEVVIRRYTKGRFLGKGGFAKCYEMTSNDTQKVYAAKVVSKASLAKNRARQKLMSEVKIHSSLHHSGVVKFELFFEDSENIYMLLELCANQTLSELIKRRRRLTELETKCYTAQLIEGLKYLHAHRVIHRDLKLGNLFLTDRMMLKIGDFGLATKLEFEGERKRTICGTPNYIAPEVLNSKVCGHSFEADVWSIGVILYAMLVGRPPFETKDVKNTYRRIRAIDYSIPEDTDISLEAKKLIRDILIAHPGERPSLDDILSSSFMTKSKIPSQLPMASLTLAPDENFINQFQRKSPKIEKFKLQSRTTTATSRRNSELTAKEEFKKSAKEFIPVELPDPRCATAKTPFKDPTISVAKTNHITRDCVASAQAYATNPLSMPMLATVKQTPSELKVLSNVGSQQRIIQGTVQASLLNSQPTANPSRGLKRSTVSAAPGTRTLDGRVEYVMHHQDYTDKYGIGYILTNGTMGFYYNDMTNLLWLERRAQFAYSDFYNKGEKGGVTYISEGCAPTNRDTEKKLKIFTHFRKYYARLSAEGKVPAMELPSASHSEPEVVLKRIIKTKNGILFRLTNNIVQMIFIDQSQIVLCFKSKTLIYINKKGAKESMKIANDLILNASEKIVDKFNYMLSLLNYINSNRGVHVRHTTANGERGAACERIMK